MAKYRSLSTDNDIDQEKYGQEDTKVTSVMGMKILGPENGTIPQGEGFDVDSVDYEENLQKMKHCCYLL